MIYSFHSTSQTRVITVHSMKMTLGKTAGLALERNARTHKGFRLQMWESAIIPLSYHCEFQELLLGINANCSCYCSDFIWFHHHQIGDKWISIHPMRRYQNLCQISTFQKSHHDNTSAWKSSKPIELSNPHNPPSIPSHPFEINMFFFSPRVTKMVPS